MHFALSIAGHDPSGASGILRDIKTFEKLQVYGLGVPTAITYQSANSASGYESMPVSWIEREIEEIMNDFEVEYVKVGMIPNSKIAMLISHLTEEYRWKVVFDPVIRTSSGMALVESPDSLKPLLKRAYVITPNIAEAEIIAGVKIESRDDAIWAGRKLRDMYGCVILKGGHLSGEDFLFCENDLSTSQPLLPRNVRGTGCAFSSALTAYLARGYGIEEAFKNAKLFVHKEIENSERLGKVYLIP